MTTRTRRRFLQDLAAGVGATAALGHRATQRPRSIAMGAETVGATSHRIFFAGFSHETNTFHPLRTTGFNFREPKPGSPPPLSLEAWKDFRPIIVPGVSAFPNGGGTIDGRACRDAMARVIQSLRQSMPVDAVYLRLHGAMYADGVGPAETVLVEQAREVVGPRTPIACTFDLHGNIPARMARFGDILVGLKTAPHTDHPQISEQAGALLRDTLAGKLKPVSYVLPIPLILQGEKAMTTAEPFRSLVEEARRIERQGVPGHAARILAATLFVGCAWTDSYDTSMCVMVTADGSRAAARAAAVHLARQIWEARRRFAFGCETAELEEGVTRALQAKEPTVFLSDSGDNVTASTPGDLPIVLRHLVERKVPSAVVAGIFDESATRRAIEAGEGQRLRLRIGATIENRFGPPLEAEVEVLRVPQKQGHSAVVRIGQVELVLMDRPWAFTDPSQFHACGIDPLSRKIVVVKEGYLFARLAAIAPRHIMLLTPGSGDMRIESLAYVRRRKPLFPLEPDTVFDPEQAPPAA